jgi:hypothetical protein
MPEAPAYNLTLAISLAAETREPFAHPDKFTKKLDSLGMKFPEAKYLGSDFNEFGKYMIALGTPAHEMDLTPLTRELGITAAKAKVDKYAKLAAEYQRRISEYLPTKLPIEVKMKAEKKLREENKQVTENGIAMKVAYTPELLRKCVNPVVSREIRSLALKHKLLGRKQRNIFRDALIKVAMIYTYVARKTRASHFGWDDISEMSTKGLTGRLASAVSYLPRQDGLKGLLEEWLEDFHLPREVREVDARTSHICSKCRGKMQEIEGRYHLMRCSKCNRAANRHENAASVSAQSLKQRIETEIVQSQFLSFA